MRRASAIEFVAWEAAPTCGRILPYAARAATDARHEKYCSRDAIRASGPRMRRVFPASFSHSPHRGNIMSFNKALPGGGRDRGAAATRSHRASSHREAPNITRCRRSIRPTSTCSTATSRAATATSPCSPTTSRCSSRTAVLTISRWTPAALYEIHIDNDGDASENLTFQFRFTNRLANDNRGIKLNIGGPQVAVPLKNVGGVSAADNSRAQLPRELPGVADARRSPHGQCVAGDRRERRHGLRQAATTSSAPRPSAASRATRLTPTPSSTRSTFPAATCRAACSWASARKASR